MKATLDTAIYEATRKVNQHQMKQRLPLGSGLKRKYLDPSKITWTETPDGRRILRKDLPFSRVSIFGLDDGFEQRDIFFDSEGRELLAHELPAKKEQPAAPKVIEFPADQHPLAYVMGLRKVDVVALADPYYATDMDRWEGLIRELTAILACERTPGQYWREIVAVLDGPDLNGEALKSRVHHWVETQRKNPEWRRERVLRELGLVDG